MRLKFLKGWSGYRAGDEVAVETIGAGVAELICRRGIAKQMTDESNRHAVKAKVRKAVRV